MEMILSIIILIVGFVFLIKGSDLFVDGASNVASLLKVPTIIIGLTVVAFGTSAPEAAVSITASIAGSNALALSNIVGSNLFNILAVIGCSAAISKLGIDKAILKQDFPFLLLITILLTIIVTFTLEINRIAGILFLILVIGYVSYLVIKAKKSKQGQIIEKPKLTLPKSIVYIIIGLVGIILGGEFVVDGAKSIALALGMSETLVGLTIVAIGTSLPELVTSLTALKRGETDLVIGNVVGSNIFNILFILGISSVISPIPVDPSMIIDLGLLTGVTLIGFIFAKTKQEYSRKEGIVLLLLFVLYMAFVIIRN